jgi:hypothetical protein
MVWCVCAHSYRCLCPSAHKRAVGMAVSLFLVEVVVPGVMSHARQFNGVALRFFNMEIQ